jgi:hypothetical protein
MGQVSIVGLRQLGGSSISAVVGLKEEGREGKHERVLQRGEHLIMKTPFVHKGPSLGR